MKSNPLPRVLHIGNIANNAFNNAKLMNATGEYDNDVICYDYYHIMGCPEWEDADFQVGPADDFFPDWDDVNTHGYRRPRWFAQGPLRMCMAYLIARRTGHPLWARVRWAELAIYRWLLAQRQLIGLAGKVRRKHLVQKIVPWLISIATSSLRALAHTARRLPLVFLDAKIIRVASSIFVRIMPAIITRLLKAALTVILMPLTILFAPMTRRTLKQMTVPETGFDDRVEALLGHWQDRFPERSDPLTRNDLSAYRPVYRGWLELLQHYDVVVGYSTDPILPMLCNKPYFAFEHGTLRSIPFEQTTQGRLTALAYALAEHCFVTNFDCMDNAKRLAGSRVTAINHPYEESHGRKTTGINEARCSLTRRLDSDFLFFFPTRQDWVAGTGYADKANDVFLKAFREMRTSGKRVGMICCEWGANVAESKAFLEEAGLDQFVVWVKPLGIVEFNRIVGACDVVVDQFKLGSFGGVLFKAMSMGKPICTYLDVDSVLARYDSPPPVINCKNTEEILGAMEELIHDPKKLLAIEAESLAWIGQYHCGRDTVTAQTVQFEHFLQSSQADRC